MENWKKLTACKTIVIKVGTSTLSYPNGRLNYQKVVRLAGTLAGIQKTGRNVILVSSGAIAVGAGRLGLVSRPPDLAGKQALAALGQAELIRIYRRFFEIRNQCIAQVLLTKDIVDNAERRENARNTLYELIKMNIIPVINENDTVATDEIEFGDNDTLSAYVAELAGADLLVLMSDIDGLYSADPRHNPEAHIIPVVHEITAELENLATETGTGFGTGGMTTKIAASRICYNAGIKVVITNGSNPENLWKIIDGKAAGTLFTCKSNSNVL